MYSSIVPLLLTLAMPVTQAGQPAQAAPQNTALPAAQRRLIVTYSDGTTSTQLLRPRGGFWKPTFPRQANPPLHDGLALSALQVDFEAGRVVVVRVSLKYGSPQQKTVEVATVWLGAEPVRVDDLERYGVEPIVLSLDEFSPVLLVQPTVTSASPMLDVTVDLIRSDVPNYKITFRNRAVRAVMAVSFKMYRGEKQVGSGRRKTNRSTPVVDAAGEYTFTMTVGSGESPGFDRFGVDGVLWDDGRIEGNPDLKASEEALTTGHAIQLRRVLEILRDATPADDAATAPKSLGQIRAAVAALPIAVHADDAAGAAAAFPRNSYSIEIGKQQVKDAVLQDLNDYLRAQPGNGQLPEKLWVDGAIATYSAWLARAGGH